MTCSLGNALETWWRRKMYIQRILMLAVVAGVKMIWIHSAKNTQFLVRCASGNVSLCVSPSLAITWQLHSWFDLNVIILNSKSCWMLWISISYLKCFPLLIQPFCGFLYGFVLAIFDRSLVHFMSIWCQIFRLGDFSISRPFPVSPALASIWLCRWSHNCLIMIILSDRKT